MVFWMPNGSTSGPRDYIHPSSPTFEAEYAVPTAKPTMPALRRSVIRDALRGLWGNFTRLTATGEASCVGITKSILLVTDGRIGPAFDSTVRRAFGSSGRATAPTGSALSTTSPTI
jgi:hypothetical protein